MSRFSKNGADDGAFQIKVIISDITYMKETCCIAGWCPSIREMKRLMIYGHHWTDADLKRIGRYVTLAVNVIPKDGGRDYPHKTEDTWIDNNFHVIRDYDNPAVLARDLKDATSKTINAIFKGNLKENSYVPFKTKCSSLGGVILPAKNITFYKESEKLRVSILDNDKNEYNLRVTCRYLRDLLDPMPDNEFADFVQQIAKSTEKAHVRVGLAKPYVYKDSNCYLMCNGVFFYHE